MKCPFCGDEVTRGRTSCGNCGAALDDLEKVEPEQQVEATEDISEVAEPTEEIEEEPVEEQVVEEEATPAEVVEAPDETTEEVLSEGEDDIEDSTPLPSNARTVKQMEQVPPGELCFIELGDLAPGTRVEGRLMEADGDIFDYFIVNEEGYNALMNGEEAQTLDEASDATKYQVELDVGEGGIYYIVIENRSQSDPVDVKVDLKVLFP